MFVSEKLLFVTTAEVTFVFNCFGASSLSNILEVLISNCLLLSGDNITVLGLEIQVGENVFGTSLTTSCSHSSAIDDAVLSSLIIGLKSGHEDSASTAEVSIPQFDFKIISGESGWFELSSDVVSLGLGCIDLE